MNYWQGKKVKLRAIEPTDAAFFIQSNLDSERARNLDFEWPPVSHAFVATWTEESSKKKLDNDSYHWIIENETGVPVGSIDTHHCNSRTGTFKYALDIIPAHQRHGYAREAILMVLRYYFEELRYQKVTVAVNGYNQPSIRLHESLGFQKEGVLRRIVFTRGQYHDEFWFGMTAEEFKEKHQGYFAKN